MAVKLRLRRMGKKKQPIYKVVAADSRSPRDGKFLEAIGLYNPLTNPYTIDIKEDRALYWLEVGAQPTDTVKSLLSKKGILLKRELMRRGLSEEQIQQEMDNWTKQHEAKSKSITSTKKAAAPKPEVKSERETTGAEAAADVSNNEDSTAEVKGAASDENAPEKE